MTARPQLWVLAGGNGVGKSTFHELVLAPRNVKLVNADIIARELNPLRPEDAGYQAAAIAMGMLEELLEEKFSFCYETVFSHVSKIDLLAKAKSLGYEIILICIHLASSGLNEARVWQRVRNGGHNVPAEKIRSRIPRTLQNLKQALPLADEAWLLDNSSKDLPFQELAVIRRRRCIKKKEPLPVWVEMLVEGL